MLAITSVYKQIVGRLPNLDKHKKKDTELAMPQPLIPPVAPAAAILASASAAVEQVIEVPAELTSGRAKHWRPEPHWVTTNDPPTH